MTNFVLDNFVAMRWFFQNLAHPYAGSVLGRIAAGEKAFVPAIWFYEVSNLLAREQIERTSAAPKVDAFLAILKSLNIAVDPQCVGHIRRRPWPRGGARPDILVDRT